MLTIHLHHLEFFAYHGLYQDEQINGNNFEVNVDINTSADEKIESLHQTIDYVSIYEIIHKRMQHPTPLLETLAQGIIHDIHVFDNRIQSITISIKKLSPPIKDFKGQVGVTIRKDF
jgi:dihydroneopterin aldolase